MADSINEVVSKQAYDQVERLNTDLLKLISNLEVINSVSKKFNLPSGANRAINNANQSKQQSNALDKEAQRLTAALERQKAKLELSQSKVNKQLIKYRFETQETNKRQKEAAILSSNLATEYQKQQVKLTQLIRKQQDLALKQELGHKLSKEELRDLKQTTAAIQKKDAALKKVDAGVGKFNRNVGNYTKALSGAKQAALSMASAMGLMGGAFLIAATIRDAFNRIREFDKEMQNLAGIVGRSRKELNILESTIISVAGSSIKTSNEVAKLATALISLGKTEKEVLLLLEPVNNLGVALQTTGDAAGELLIQTLNAFGKGAESGQEYADIIAKIRTSTALDFERISDALGYLAPTANALGLSLEQTGAILGVLNDNGIKAARAGRLMSSSFARLNKQGNTLEGALEEINNSTDKVGTATRLFGTESFTLGLILADNIEKTKEYTKSFEDAEGALKSLTDEQLKSLDAQLKILDSTWEEFILSLDNGQGSISKVFSALVGFINDAVKGMTALNKTTEDKANDSYNKMLKERARIYKEAGENAEKFAKIDSQNASVEVFNLQKRITELNKQRQQINDDTGGGLGWIRRAGEVKSLNSEIENLNRELGRQKAIRDAANNVLNEETKAIEENEEQLVASKTTRKKLVAINQDLFKQQDNLATGTIAYYQVLISALRDVQNEVSRTSKEYQEAEESILKFQAAIDRIKSDDLFNIDQDALTKSLEGWANAADSARERDLKKEEEFQKKKMQLIGESLQRIADMYGVDASKFEFLYDGKINTVEEFAEGAGELLKGLNNAIYQNSVRNINAEIDREREKYDYLIDAAEGNEQQQEFLRQEAARKERKLLNERARAEKRAAIFESIINTGVAVVKALPNIPLSITVGALGAVQTALIASQPLPQYKTGRKGGKEEMAILGDGYKNEPIIDKHGNLKGISPNKPTVMHLDKGDSVLPSMEDLRRSSVMSSLNSAKGYDAGASLELRLASILKTSQKGIIKSLRNANFVNQNNVNVDLGFANKKQRYS